MYDPTYSVSFAQCATPEQIEENNDDFWIAILDAAVPFMDDEIREAIHADMADTTALSFLLEYMERHYAAYGMHFEWV